MRIPRFVLLLIAFSSIIPGMAYYPISPYAYCAGNPLKYSDPTGQDIVILNYTQGQHMAMLIQHEDKKWYYYSINGNNVYISGKHSGGREFNDIGVGCWNSPQEFLDSEYNTEDGTRTKNDKNFNHFGYEEGYQIQTTDEQDAKMQNDFVKKSKTEYDIVTNNCATTVQEVMINAGIPVSKPSYSPSFLPTPTPYGTVNIRNGFDIKCSISSIPSVAFKSIVKWNQNGKYIKKRNGTK